MSQRGRIFVAELVGTLILVVGGPGTAIFAGSKVGNLGVALAFGLSLLCAAYLFGSISGCHINPAVTIGLWAMGKTKSRDVPLYVVAQLIGAVLGGLIIWGLQPGPLLFKEKPEFVWGLIASMYTGNILGVLIVLAFVPFFAAILRIPFAILTPLIVVLCAIGSYAVHNAMIDVWYMLLFGVVGYVFKKLDYPLAPLVLALVLGDMAENALRQSLIMSQGSLAIFFIRPISGVITALAILFFLMPVITPWWRRLRGLPASAPAPRET